MKKLFTFIVISSFLLSFTFLNGQDKKVDKEPPKIPVSSINNPYINNNSIIDAVSGIAFTQTSGTYSAIAGTTIIAASTDDASSTIQNIGFNFVYNGTVFTQFAANSNGYIQLGAVPGTYYTPLSSVPNCIAFCGRDGRTGGAVTYLLSGTSPNRVLTIQYPSYALTYSSTANIVDAQIKLYETTNVIEIIYGTSARTATYTPQVGITGATTTDFSDRMLGTSWAATVAGSANTSTMTWSTTYYPASGQIYRWSPGVEIGAYPWKEYFNVWPPPNFNLTGGTQNWFQYISATDSSARANFWSWSSGINALMQTPLLNLTSSTGLTAPALSFRWSHLYSSSYPTDSLGVYITTNSGTTWIGIWGLKGAAFNSGDGASYTTPGTYVTANVDLTTYLNQRVNIRFVGYSGYGPDCFISDVSVLNAGPPSVTTTTPTSISTSTATSGGNVTSQGSSPVTARGVCWSTSANPTIANSKTIDGSGTGIFTSSITGLTASTLYHVRAYATNSSGTSYGSDLTFTTSCANSTLPFSQGFNSATIPGCWSTQFVTGASAIQYVASSSYPTTVPQEGTNYVFWNSFSFSSGNSTRLVSPPITTTGTSSVDVSFYWMHDPGYPGNADGMYVEYSTDGTNWTIVGSMIPRYDATLTGWNLKKVTLPAAAGNQPTIYVGFRFYSAYGNNCSMDNISIQATPANPVFSISPILKAFGNTTVGGGSVDQTFTITNTGGGTLIINSGDFTLAGTDPDQYQLLNATDLNLTTGQSGTVRVQFTPTTPGSKSAILRIDDNIPSSHDIELTGTGVLNAPQTLVGGLNASFKPSLTWQAPAPGNEIKIDDGTVEQNMWVGTPSNTSQMFFDRFVSPHNGTISQIGIYAYSTTTGNLFNSVMLCPDDGSGKPNTGAPYATFSNVAVGTSAAWIFLNLSTPQNVTAGQTFYIVTQWPAGSTTGPYIGTDNTVPNGRSYWTQDGGTTWNAWAGNFLMRAYMGTYSDKLISGETPAGMKLLKPISVNNTKKKNEYMEHDKIEKPASIPAALIFGKNGERVLSSYTVKRGLSSGSYNQSFTGISALTYDDNSVTMGLTYYYVVEAVYTEGTSSYSNEVSVTAVNPNYGNIMLGTYDYKFSNNTANGNPGSNEKPVYEWYPTTDFTTITFSDDDDGYSQVNFPGQYFKFFNNDYSSVYVGTNGYLTFGSGSTDYSPAGALPQVGDPANMIAAAFMDLYNRTTYSPATKISYKIFTDKVVISYENIYQISAASGQNYISYQIILCTNTSSPTTNSVFVINYNDDMSYSPLNTNTIVTGASVGVNGPAGSNGYNYRYTGVKGPMFSGITLSPNGANSLALGFADMNAPLPVNLSSFTFKLNGRDVSLSWITEIEINNAGFDVERKSSEGQWAKVGYISGKGSTNIPTNYSFDDKKLSSGKYNYRLKQIDNNGNFTYHTLSNEVEVALPTKYNLSQNYPNPFNPTTKIDFDLPFDSKVNIVLYDITGREVKTLFNDARTAGYHTLQFNASDLSSGTYFYRIMTKSAGADYVMTKKMVLIK